MLFPQAEFWPYANGKVTSTEMKTLTKIIVASTAGILSAGLATAGAFAATGAFSVQDQAGAAIAAHGVTGAAKSAAQSAAATAEQKAAALRGEVSKLAGQAPAVPTLPTTVPSGVPAVPGVPSVPGVTTGSGTLSGSVSGTAGSVTGSGTAGATGTAGTSGASATGGAAATVVAPPAAVDVRGSGSATLSH